MTKTFVVFMLFYAHCGNAQVQPSIEFQTKRFAVEALGATRLTPGKIQALVPRSTFQVFGHNKEGEGCTGTGFILHHQVGGSNHPKKTQFVLLTAAHVFSDCVESDGTVKVRFRYGEDDHPAEWRLVDRVLHIVDSGRPLWIKHPNEDVAAFPLGSSLDAIDTILPTDLLATKQRLGDFYLGHDTYAAGYPLGTALNFSGFPILRFGKIASPVISARSVFEVSFQVYPGDSGAPIYVIERTLEEFRIVILGLVVRAEVKTTTLKTKDGSREIQMFTGVSIVAPATALQETVNLLVNKHSTYR